MKLDRRDQVLKLIVEDFIKTAEPVGSHRLIEKYNLQVSSATIRNDMNSLEKDGYLEKTHTSSGRVPSSKGYKYYIEHLRNPSVDSKIKNEVQMMFSKTNSVEDILQESCEILSNMTNLASVVLGPSADEERLISVQLVPLNATKFTAIFVTDKGYVENKTFAVNGDVKLEDVKKCIEILNERLKGTQINHLVDKLEAIRPIISDYVSDYTYLYNTLAKTFYDFANQRNQEFYGKENLIKQPEFRDDAESLKRIFGLFDKPEELQKMIECTDDGIVVDCGEFNDDYSDVSVISKEIVANGENVGKIAIIGPSRMDYNKVLESLDYVVEQIMQKLSFDLIGGEED